MPNLYDRKIVVTITDPAIRGLGENAFEITELRMAFEIKKSLGKEPNTATLTINNLSEGNRARIVKGSKLAIEAGYKDTIAQIFIGDVRTVESKKLGATWETRIDCGDGERAFRFARAGESFAPGTTYYAVIKRLADIMGLDPGNLSTVVKPSLGQYANGYAAHGSASLEMDRVCRAAGLSYSIQEGALLFLKANDTRNEIVVEIGSNSGLVGSPEYGAPPAKGKPRLLKVRSLLNPKIKAGGRVDLLALVNKGLHKVVNVSHNGDTHGGEWYTDFECKPI